MTAATPNHSEQGHTQTHSQTPWVGMSQSTDFRAMDSELVGMTNPTSPRALANRAFIVLCVNSHEALVKALELAIVTMQLDSVSFNIDTIAVARAALSLARNEQHTKEGE